MGRIGKSLSRSGGLQCAAFVCIDRVLGTLKAVAHEIHEGHKSLSVSGFYIFRVYLPDSWAAHFRRADSKQKIATETKLRFSPSQVPLHYLRFPLLDKECHRADRIILNRR